MAAWLAITRASVMCVMSSLSARASELLVGPEGLSGLGNGVVGVDNAVQRRLTTLEMGRSLTAWGIRMPGTWCSAFGIPCHLCRKYFSASGGAACARTEYVLEGQERGVGSCWGRLAHRGVVVDNTRVADVRHDCPSICPQKRAAGSRFETRRFGVCLRCKSGDVEPRGRRRMADSPPPEPAVAHGFARGFLVFNLPD